tara:strand:- start:5344 stop:5472 length:129 start_codon:yes stop_codon:yes gene_type:complete
MAEQQQVRHAVILPQAFATTTFMTMQQLTKYVKPFWEVVLEK